MIGDMKSYVAEKKAELKTKIAKAGIAPVLAIIQVGDNAASNSYVKGKLKDCREVGVEGIHIRLGANISQDEFDTTISAINSMPGVHGIIVQLPVPAHLKVDANLIAAGKDVDGFRVDSPYIPCTPLGICNFLVDSGVKIAGMNAVVIGRSEIVGKPMAKLLMDKNATVTICHSKTQDIAAYTKTADLIIVAAGKRNMLTRNMIGDNHPIVIDVGINRDDDGKLRGDCDYQNLLDMCEYVSPVPGGVGLLTRLSLMQNVFTAMEVLK